MKLFGNDVNDKSMKVSGGLQRIITQDGYYIPLNIISGLPYMSMRPYTDDEWDDLPHLILTGDTDWDPSILDHNIDDDERWFDAISDLPNDNISPLFDHYRNYRHRHAVHFHNINDSDLNNDIFQIKPTFIKLLQQILPPMNVQLFQKNLIIHHSFLILVGNPLTLLRELLLQPHNMHVFL